MDKMKEVTFDCVNDKQWYTVAEQSLRGNAFENLMTKTIEGMTISPLYTKEMYEAYFQGNSEPLLQHIRQGIGSTDWIIAQMSYEKNSGDFLREMEASLTKGNEAVFYDGSRPVQWEIEDLEKLAAIVTTRPLYACNIEEHDEFTALFEMIPPEGRSEVKGVVTGVDLPNGFINIRTECADLIHIHQQGADIITELAVFLALAVKGAERYSSFGEFARNNAVRFAVDTDFFMEMAKLRASRVLWHTLCRSYDTRHIKIPIIAETSLRTYTTFDPYTNMLRASNETLSAVLGGADVFTVHPHLLLREISASSIRAARNIQLVVREETFVKHVLDPAGGSYYIDILTNEIVKKAWQLFQQIEAAGGYDHYAATGNLQKQIEKSASRRHEQLNNGERVLVGTNKFADPDEEYLNKSAIQISHRLAEQYESLRKKFQTDAPSVVLLTFGELTDYKMKADFAKGILAVGGIKPTISPVFMKVQQMNAWLHQNTFDYYIICSSTEHIFQILKTAASLADKWVDVAGSFAKQEIAAFKQNGVDDVFFKGQSQLQKLLSVYEKWERRM